MTAPAPASAALAASEDDRVVLVSESGQPIGTSARSSVHGRDTPLHLAFSLYAFNEAGEVLFTRRALGKAAWPGVWTNTCCGHPLPGEQLEHAVQRRLGQELGVSVEDLRCALPDFRYRATDAGGVVENEICPVYLGRLHPNARLRPNPHEVMDWKWVRWDDVTSAARRTPFVLSPWSVLQMDQLATIAG